MMRYSPNSDFTKHKIKISVCDKSDCMNRGDAHVSGRKRVALTSTANRTASIHLSQHRPARSYIGRTRDVWDHPCWEPSGKGASWP